MEPRQRHGGRPGGNERAGIREQMTETAENIEWYLARDGQQYGPVTEPELLKVIELGHLNADDLVWRAGFEQWQAVSEVFPDQIEKAAQLAPDEADEPEPAPASTEDNPQQHIAGSAADASSATSAENEEPEAAPAAPADEKPSASADDQPEPVKAAEQPAAQTPEQAADPIANTTAAVESPPIEAPTVEAMAPVVDDKAAPAKPDNAPSATEPKAAAPSDTTVPLRQSRETSAATEADRPRHRHDPQPAPKSERAPEQETGPSTPADTRFAARHSGHQAAEPRTSQPTDRPISQPAGYGSYQPQPMTGQPQLGQPGQARPQDAQARHGHAHPAHPQHWQPANPAEAAPRQHHAGQHQPGPSQSGPLPGHPGQLRPPGQAPMHAPAHDPRTHGGQPGPRGERPNPHSLDWENARSAHPNGQGSGPGQRAVRPEHDGYAASDFEQEEAPPRRRSFVGSAIRTLLLASFVGALSAGGWFVYTERDAALKLYSQLTGQEGGKDGPAIVAAPREPARIPVGAETQTTAPPQAPASTTPAGTPPTGTRVAATAPSPPAAPPKPKLPILTTALWRSYQESFPDWAKKIEDEVAVRQEAQRPDASTSESIVKAMVRLRRNNAAAALSAPPAEITAIAASFTANLRFLRKSSIDACYGFIAEGELSTHVLPMLADPTRSGPLPAQSIAVMRAIAAGRKNTTRYAEPRKEDFDALSRELRKRGWSQDDLRLFSDPAALSKAPHAKVCGLVLEWFETQLALPDGPQKMRLLTASLNPVVAG